MGRLDILRPGSEGRPDRGKRLDSWKEIAAYFNRGVRTVQRWEQEENLPVHRLTHGKQGSVFALTHELEAWWESRRDQLANGGKNPPQAARATKPASHRRIVWVAVAVVLLAAATVAWTYLTRAKAPLPVPSEVQLTSYPGQEWHPRFSPDGTKLTFCYMPEGRQDYDIYVKQIGVDTPLPLVETPSSEGSAVWSPDGKFILFARNSDTEPARYDVLRIPAIGGNEVKLTEAYGPSNWCSLLENLCPWLAWSPDGDWIIMVDRSGPTEPTALFAFSLRNHQKHRLTNPPAETLGDAGPAFSPDGRMVAFHRLFAGGLSEIFVLDVSADLAPRSAPRQVTSVGGYAVSPEWTLDGNEVVFSLGTTRRYEPYIGRVDVKGSRPPQLLSYVSRGAWFPTVSPSGARLAFTHHSWRANVYSLNLSGSGDETDGLLPVIRSTAVDLEPSYSPECDRITFSSDQTGHRAIWVANADGSNPVRLTDPVEAQDLGPRWSPDGQRIVYASDRNGNRDLFVVDTRGGDPVRLTFHPADDSSPEWSKDGKWIYFGSLRSDSSQIWRIPATGGPAIQVTKNGGARPRRSRDGRSIYYAKSPIVPTSIWRVGSGGGLESEVVSRGALVDQFAPVTSGIYYIPVAMPPASLDLLFRDVKTGTDEKVATLQAVSLNCSRCMDWNESGLAVSHDERTILFGKVDAFDADLMLVENFR